MTTGKKKITGTDILIALIPIFLFMVTNAIGILVTGADHSIANVLISTMVFSLMGLVVGAGLGPLAFALFLLVKGNSKASDIAAYIIFILGAALGTFIGSIVQIFAYAIGYTDISLKITTALDVVYFIVATIILIRNLMRYNNH